jgi:hypothetical protein
MRIIVAIIAVGLSSIACGQTDVAPTPPSPPPSIVAPVTSPSTTAPTGSASTVDWGPLAVVPPQDGADTARTEGILRITEACVFLDTAGGPVVLVWPADRTEWDAEARTVGFTNFDGRRARVADGVPVVVGGSGGSAQEDGVTVDAWLARTPWVARPAAACPLESWWAVGALMSAG